MVRPHVLVPLCWELHCRRCSVPFCSMNYRQRPCFSSPWATCTPTQHKPTALVLFLDRVLDFINKLWSRCNSLFVHQWHVVVSVLLNIWRQHQNKTNACEVLLNIIQVCSGFSLDTMAWTMRLCGVLITTVRSQGHMRGYTSHFTPPVFSIASADLRWMAIDFPSSLFSCAFLDFDIQFDLLCHFWHD